MGVYHFLEQL